MCSRSSLLCWYTVHILETSYPQKLDTMIWITTVEIEDYIGMEYSNDAAVTILMSYLDAIMIVIRD